MHFHLIFRPLSDTAFVTYNVVVALWADLHECSNVHVKLLSYFFG